MTYEPSTCAALNKLQSRWLEIDSMAGVGIDPQPDLIPQDIWQSVGGRKNHSEGVSLFTERIIDATAPFSVDYKVNAGFFEGELGRKALHSTFKHLKESHPNVLRICDGKFGDVQHTAERIADALFGELDADAVVLNPYLGEDAIEPFTRWKNKLVVLCINTSNPSAKRVQELEMADGRMLWQHILDQAMDEWNGNGNILPILSATHPDNLIGIRDRIGQTPLLLAGIGTQGGDLLKSIPHVLDEQGYGLMISASRAILYPELLPGESGVDASARTASELKRAINAAKAAYAKN